MLRSVLATLGIIGVAAWVFSPSATGAPELVDTVAPAVVTVAGSAGAADGTGASPGGDDAVSKDAVMKKVAGAWSRIAGRRADRGLDRAVATRTRALPAPHEPPPSWVTAPPPRRTQTEKSSSSRGINPCLSPDPGFGNFERWDRSPSLGQMIVPKGLVLDERQRFDVMIHFHGHEAARKEWVQAVDGAVLVGIDLGNNSGPYTRKFADPGAFAELLTSVEQGVAASLGVSEAHIGKLGLSSWSAGYGAIEQALRGRLARRPDVVILLDGLHTGHADTERAKSMLRPFVDYARGAAEGRGLMFVSHSSIVPPTYASTTETANYLVWQLGARPERAGKRDGDPMGLELIRQYSESNFHVRGFSGNGKLDHCAHLGLYRSVLQSLVAPRWALPLPSAE